jgi:type VI secretion system secreted protein Hcp
MKKAQIILTVFLMLLTCDITFAQKGFMKIGDIDGESSQRGYVNWIVIDAFSNGLERAQQVAGATRRLGSVEFTDIVVTKKADKSTPKLMELCAKGQIVPELEMVLLSKDNKALYKVTLNNVRVSSIISKAACTPECEIVDEFSLSYAKITWEYWDSKGEKVMSTFNVATNN